MGINILKNYLSRGQVREYLNYIMDDGVDEIIESPDSVSATDPLPIRIGSSINSIKIFHVARLKGEEFWLTQVGINLSINDTKPDIPEGTSCVGIFYMSKNGRDYSGDPDSLNGTKVQGDIGDVVWFDVDTWESVTLGPSSEGANYRLFVFWNAAPASGITD